MNPRFPHRCKVYRAENANAFSDGVETIIYEGQCRKYSGYRATDPDGVAKELFALSIPIIYKGNGEYHISNHGDVSEIEEVNPTLYPNEGDMVEITTQIGDFKGRITQIMAGNFGTTMHFEDVKR